MTNKKFNKDTLCICFILAVMVWAVFGQTRHFDFVNYDDDIYVYENIHITNGLTIDGIQWSLTHEHGGNFHPLTSLSHMIDVQLYGLDPGGHHLSNVLLHMANVMLLFWLLYLMCGSLWCSAFLAAFFVVLQAAA